MSATTIAEIARLAGVGTATVDRVLNGRAGVHVDTAQRVLQAMAELGKPPLRGRPRRHGNFRFAFVLPVDAAPFTDLVDREIAHSAGEFRHQHITEITQRFDTANAVDFASQVARIEDCDGIAIMAPDLPPIKHVINELVRSGVHVVTLFSDVAGSMRETHIGQDNRAAGRTAGLLLGRMAIAPRDILLLSSPATRLTAEIERRIGFAQIIEERFTRLRVVRTPDLPADDDGAARTLLRWIRKEGNADRIAGIYNIGAGSAGVARAVASVGLAGAIGVVAHDLTERHRALLGDGELTYVLHQDLHYGVLAAARVLRGLCENVRGALTVVQPRIEILTAENLH